MTATIYALSSGAAPAGIAVIRVSGPDAETAMRALLGRSIVPRRTSLNPVRDPASGEVLDQALCLWFPGPRSATGEDVFELHAHGGRAVVAAILRALSRLPGLRQAEPGEFTRRALEHGRIDLIEAEGLADLLAAETEDQRRQAMAMASGALSQAIRGWDERLLAASALIEARLDFADEDDVVADGVAFADARAAITTLLDEWRVWLARPRAERLRDGISVAVAGPPNAGKSTLINVLVQRDVAITSSLPGTTRDVIEVPVAIGGIAFRLADTAGLHDDSGDPIEREGMERARQWMNGADIVLWLGEPADAPDRPGVIPIHAKADLLDEEAQGAGSDIGLLLSAHSGEGMDQLHATLIAAGRACLPGVGEVAMTERQWAGLAEAAGILERMADTDDLLLLGEAVRLARAALTRITGHVGTEAMLDTLFGRFCIGK